MTASETEAAALSWRPRHHPIVIALTVTLATFMEILDTSIANVALPHIAGSLSASIDESTWVLTSYLVSNAVVLPLSGWLSSLIGRKRFYMLCVVLFTASSLLCGFAPNLGALVFFRILQGIGGGGMQPSEQAILVDTFRPEQRGMGMAIYGMAVVTAPIIGPTLGGWITDNFSWRWIFFINIPVGLLSLFLTARLVEDPPYLLRKNRKDGLRIDYPGLILICLGLGLLQVVLDTGERSDWFGSASIVTASIVSATCLLGALFWEFRAKDPIVDLHLLKERNFFISNVLMFVLGFVLYGSTVLLPLFLQTLMGYSSVLSGMVLSPGGIITLFLMPLVGYLVSRVDGRFLVATGIALASFGVFLMAKFSLEVDFRTAMISRMVQSAGLAFLFVPINAMAFSFIAKEKSNNATGIINLARNIGGSVGIAVGATIVARRAQLHHQQLVSHLTPYDAEYKQTLAWMQNRLHSAGSYSADTALKAHKLLYDWVGEQAAMLAYIDAFWAFGAIFLVMIPLVFCMKKAKLGKEISIH